MKPNLKYALIPTVGIVEPAVVSDWLLFVCPVMIQ
jgi:hypothetical protein